MDLTAGYPIVQSAKNVPDIIKIVSKVTRPGWLTRPGALVLVQKNFWTRSCVDWANNARFTEHDWKGRECRAHYSQNWLLRVKSSALVTGFVLAEGTHQMRCLFGEF